MSRRSVLPKMHCGLCGTSIHRGYHCCCRIVNGCLSAIYRCPSCGRAHNHFGHKFNDQENGNAIFVVDKKLVMVTKAEEKGFSPAEYRRKLDEERQLHEAMKRNLVLPLEF